MSTRTHIGQLEVAGLIELAQAQPELEYLFRHALIQDAAYGSLLSQDKKRLHRAVAETLEQGYSDQLDELAALLGRHFSEAGVLQQAFHYFVLAADYAAGVHAHQEAEALYARAILLTADLEATGSELTKIYAGRGRMLEHAGRFQEAVNVYREMETLAQDRRDQAMACVAMARLASCYVEPTAVHNIELADALLDRGLTLAREIGDPELEVDLLWSQLVRETHSGRSRKAQAVGEQCLAIARQNDLRPQMARVLHDLSLNLRFNGRLKVGERYAEEARSLFRQSGNLPMLVDNLNQQGLMDTLHLDFDAALDRINEAYEISRRIDNGWNVAYSTWLKGMISEVKGDWDPAQAQFRTSIQLGRRVGFLMSSTVVPLQYGRLLRRLGLIEQARVLHEAAHAACEEQAPFMLRGARAELALDALAAKDVEDGHHWLMRARESEQPGEIGTVLTLGSLPRAEVVWAAHDGNWAAALSIVEQTLQEAKRRRLSYYVVPLMVDRGRCLMGLGRLAEAEKQLETALDLANGLHYLQWQIYVALVRVAGERGLQRESERHRKLASRTLKALIQSLGEREQRMRIKAHLESNRGY